MASGQVNRTNRPNTWLLRPTLQMKILLANPEPSTHGPLAKWRTAALRSAPGRSADRNCSGRVFRILTRCGHQRLKRAGNEALGLAQLDVVNSRSGTV